MPRAKINGPHTNVFCEMCGDEKEMYHTPWCPVCEKPEKQLREVLNFIKATQHIEAITNDIGTDRHYHDDCYSRRVWKWMLKTEKIPGNNSFISFWRPEGLDEALTEEQEDNDETNSYGFTEQERKDIKLFCDTFNITEYGTICEIRW